jgi:hypothetical protein
VFYTKEDLVRYLGEKDTDIYLKYRKNNKAD